MRIISCILLCLSVTLSAHEFVHTQKNRRVTLSVIKDEYGQMFGQQLKETAFIVQAIGRVQRFTIDENCFSVQAMQDTVCRLRHYTTQLTDLAHPLSSEQIQSNTVSEKQFLADLTIIIGSMQQQLIHHLQDLLDDTGVFVRQHMSVLMDLMPNIKQHTVELQSVHKRLVEMEQSAQKKKQSVLATEK